MKFFFLRTRKLAAYQRAANRIKRARSFAQNADPNDPCSGQYARGYYDALDAAERIIREELFRA